MHFVDHSPDNATWYWWSDAQFVPYKDICLYATTSAYQPRVSRPWVSASHMPNGKVMLYHLSGPDQMREFGNNFNVMFLNELNRFDCIDQK